MNSFDELKPDDPCSSIQNPTVKSDALYETLKSNDKDAPARDADETFAKCKDRKTIMACVYASPEIMSRRDFSDSATEFFSSEEYPFSHSASSEDDQSIRSRESWMACVYASPKWEQPPKKKKGILAKLFKWIEKK